MVNGVAQDTNNKANLLVALLLPRMMNTASRL